VAALSAQTLIDRNIDILVHHNLPYSKFKQFMIVFFHIWDRIMDTEGLDYGKMYNKLGEQQLEKSDRLPVIVVHPLNFV
jgi:hypothetical protein